MSLGLHDYERRRRRQAWIRVAKSLFFLGLVLGVSLFAYQIGIEQMKERTLALQAELDALSQDKQELEQQILRLQQLAGAAEQKAAVLAHRLERELPVGEHARLSRLVRERLEAGVDPGRLAFVISAAGNPRSCSAPETKRFIVETPIYKGPNTAVAFAGGTITVSGKGESATSPEGNPEGWFDPAKPVTLTFTQIGGRTSVATGLLPLHHALVIDDTEHRFSAIAGSRSFIEITWDTCPYP